MFKQAVESFEQHWNMLDAILCTQIPLETWLIGYLTVLMGLRLVTMKRKNRTPQQSWGHVYAIYALMGPVIVSTIMGGELPLGIGLALITIAAKTAPGVVQSQLNNGQVVTLTT